MTQHRSQRVDSLGKGKQESVIFRHSVKQNFKGGKWSKVKNGPFS